MKFIHSSWHLLMDSKHNPLSKIPDVNTRHLIMQVLAWMWCIIFSMYMGSIFVFGVSALVHAILISLSLCSKPPTGVRNFSDEVTLLLCSMFNRLTTMMCLRM